MIATGASARTWAAAIALCVVLALFACCGDDAPEGATDTPTTASSNGPGAGGDSSGGRISRELPQFVDVSVEAGITAGNHSGKPMQKDWIVSGMGGGSIIMDYDRDGDMDLLVVDGTMLTSAGNLEYSDDARTRLFRNDGDLKFTDVSLEAGIDIQSFGFGGASGAYDNDGWPDFYGCNWGRNYLMRNKGDGTFEDTTEAAGLLGDPNDMSTHCSWGDLNGDGVLDVYVSNYIDQWKQIREFQKVGKPGRSCKWRGFNVYCGPPGLDPQKDRLYFGNGDGTFREVTDTHLTNQKDWRYAFTSVMTDVDDDGDLDIYVANDTQNNSLWINDGEGTMTDMGLEASVAMNVDAAQQAGMGVDAADFNRDGKIDLAVTNFSHDYNTIYLNRTRKKDRPTFGDKTHMVNGATVSYRRLCWGMRLFDYDNDTDLDMFVGCGHVYGEIDQFARATGTSYKQQCLMLRCDGPPQYRFTDVTQESGPGLKVKRVWRGAVFSDFDNDGDIDVFVTSLNGKPALFRNDGGNTNAFLVFRLEGTGKLRDPTGARVYVHLDNGTILLEEKHHGAAFCSDNDPRLFFGLGGHKVVKKVEVRWPNGDKQAFTDVATRRFYLVRQGEDALHEENH